MASKIRLLRAPTLEDLEHVINEAFAEMAEDVRIEINLAGGINFANGEYIAPICINAPHKRRLDDPD